MEKTPGSYQYQDSEGNLVEENLFSFSPEEQQENIEARNNAEILWHPQFIQVPYYEWKKYKLSPLEGMIYGFIKYIISSGRKFYVSNKKLAELFEVHPMTISSTISKFKKYGLISSYQPVGRNRIISLPPLSAQAYPSVNPKSPHLEVEASTLIPLSSATYLYKNINNNIKREIKEKREKEKTFSPLSQKISERRKLCSPRGEAGVVFLTDDEMRKISQQYGRSNLNRYIKALNDWKMAKGKENKSDYHTILNWIRCDLQTKKLVITSFDFDEDDFDTKAEYDEKINRY